MDCPQMCPSRAHPPLAVEIVLTAFRIGKIPFAFFPWFVRAHPFVWVHIVFAAGLAAAWRMGCRVGPNPFFRCHYSGTPVLAQHPVGNSPKPEDR